LVFNFVFVFSSPLLRPLRSKTPRTLPRIFPRVNNPYERQN
jgi:hypothetical protein